MEEVTQVGFASRLAFPTLPSSVPMWAAGLGLVVSVGIGQHTRSVIRKLVAASPGNGECESILGNSYQLIARDDGIKSFLR